MTYQPDVDWAEHAAHLADAAHDDAAWYESVAAGLVRPGDALLADVGCGGAGMAAALAHAAPSAVVVAVDADAEVLAGARANLDRVAPQVRTAVADLTGHPGELASAIGGSADLIWASGVVHHAPDQQGATDLLAGLLAPGGRLALAEGGLTGRHLPWDLGLGEPGLELRLEAAQDRWFTAMRASLPQAVRMPYGWTTALRRAGLTDVATQSRLLERPMPLSGDDRERVVAKLAHRVEHLRDRDVLDQGDLAIWERLLDPDDTAWLGRRDDLFDLDARSVHTGTRPQS
jgi:SAM-dependent methyltransferase